MKPAKFIAAHKVFRFDEFLAAHTASGASPNTTAAVLQYYVRLGRLKSLRRGIYVRDLDIDPWVLGSRLSADAVIAYEGALSFHGVWPLAHSMSFLTNERMEQFRFNEVVYRPVRVSKALADRRGWGGEILTVEREGQPVKVTSLERTLVDLLDRLDLGYGSKALWDCFRSVDFDWELMLGYARKRDNRLLVGRLAVFLQLMGAKNKILDQFDRFAPRSACYFDQSKRQKGDRLFRRWSVIMPHDLMQHIETGATASLDT
jgi:predicted transcriptional regulator of viral defense system